MISILQTVQQPEMQQSSAPAEANSALSIKNFTDFVLIIFQIDSLQVTPQKQNFKIYDSGF